jgi:2'-5' RNA ligase
MRVFVAVPLPSDIKDRITDLMMDLKNRLPAEAAPVAWTKKENLHITLKFLGEVNDAQIPLLKGVLSAAAQHTASFDLQLAQLHTFSSDGPIRTLWLGVSPSSELQAIAEKVIAQCEANGFRREKRAFQAHVTLGRIKSVKGQAVIPSVTTPPATAVEKTFRVNKIVLMRSILSAAGSTYTPVHTAHLK